MAAAIGAVLEVPVTRTGFQEPWKAVLDRQVQGIVLSCVDGRIALDQRKVLRDLLEVPYYHQLSLTGAPHCLGHQFNGGVEWTHERSQDMDICGKALLRSIEILVGAGATKLAVVSHQSCRFVEKVLGLHWDGFRDERAWHLISRQHAVDFLKERFPQLQIFSGFAHAHATQPGYVQMGDWARVS